MAPMPDPPPRIRIIWQTRKHDAEPSKIDVLSKVWYESTNWTQGPRIIFKRHIPPSCNQNHLVVHSEERLKRQVRIGRRRILSLDFLEPSSD